MTLLALAAIAFGLFLWDGLCPKIQLSGSPYNWPTPLRVLTFTSFALGLDGWVPVFVCSGRLDVLAMNDRGQCQQLSAPVSNASVAPFPAG